MMQDEMSWMGGKGRKREERGGRGGGKGSGSIVGIKYMCADADSTASAVDDASKVSRLIQGGWKWDGEGGKGKKQKRQREEKRRGREKRRQKGERTSEITSFTTLDQSSSSRNEQSTSTLSLSLILSTFLPFLNPIMTSFQNLPFHFLGTQTNLHHPSFSTPLIEHFFRLLIQEYELCNYLFIAFLLLSSSSKESSPPATSIGCRVNQMTTHIPLHINLKRKKYQGLDRGRKKRERPS